MIYKTESSIEIVKKVTYMYLIANKVALSQLFPI